MSKLKTSEKTIKEKEYWDNVKERGITRRTPNNPVVRFFTDQRLEYIKKRIDFDSVKTCLDVGCGTGFSSSNFPKDKEVIGLDFSRRLLIQNPNKLKIQGSGMTLPFKSNSFDLVYGWEFLHHLDTPEKAVKEMARVTKKYLILFEPNRYNPAIFLYSLYLKSERKQLHYCKSKLLEFLEIIGFNLISCDSVGFVFAGSSPEFSLGVCKHLPFISRAGAFVSLICEKPIK